MGLENVVAEAGRRASHHSARQLAKGGRRFCAMGWRRANGAGSARRDGAAQTALALRDGMAPRSAEPAPTSM